MTKKKRINMTFAEIKAKLDPTLAVPAAHALNGEQLKEVIRQGKASGKRNFCLGYLHCCFLCGASEGNASFRVWYDTKRGTLSICYYDSDYARLVWHTLNYYMVVHKALYGNAWVDTFTSTLPPTIDLMSLEDDDYEEAAERLSDMLGLVY